MNDNTQGSLALYSFELLNSTAILLFSLIDWVFQGNNYLIEKDVHKALIYFIVFYFQFTSGGCDPPWCQISQDTMCWKYKKNIEMNILLYNAI